MRLIRRWSSPIIWWRMPVLSAQLPTLQLRTKLTRAFDSKICLVMAPDQKLAIELPQDALNIWGSSAPAGADRGVYKGLADLAVPFYVPPVIGGEPYNWRLPQRGATLFQLGSLLS